MCIIENLKMEDFTYFSNHLTSKYTEALKNNQDTELWLCKICELVWQYIPLIEYEIYVLNNVHMQSSMEQFRERLLELYVNGWKDAWFYYRQIYGFDSMSAEAA